MNKLLYLLLLFTSIVYSQDSISTSFSNYSIIKNIKNPDIVYRGIINPITIHVPKAKSFTAIGLGLTKKSDNIYILSPGQGKEVEIKLEITLQNDSIIKESQFFKIKDLSSLLGLINGKNCYDCIIKLSKEDFLNGTITYTIPDFWFDFKYRKIVSFDIILNRNKSISVTGNKIPLEILNKIKTGKSIQIRNIRAENPNNICSQKIYPIDILIIE
jgi:hypothetical protein